MLKAYTFQKSHFPDQAYSNDIGLPLDFMTFGIQKDDKIIFVIG